MNYSALSGVQQGMTSASDLNPHVNHDLTSVLPRKRAGLSASGEVPRRTLDREWTIVAPGRVVPPPRRDPTSFGGFPADALDRARGHWLNQPDAIIGGWSSCPFHNLAPDWADLAPTVLYADRCHSGGTDTTAAVQTPLRAVVYPVPADVLPVICPDPHLPDLMVADARTAVVQ